MAINFDKMNYRKHSSKNKDLINKSLKECSEFDIDLLNEDFDVKTLNDWG